MANRRRTLREYGTGDIVTNTQIAALLLEHPNATLRCACDYASTGKVESAYYDHKQNEIYLYCD